MTSPRIIWDLGTAYDLFISLYVLHDPVEFGLRGVWAAGMRSRLPPADRDFLEQVQSSVVWGAPISWVHSLPPPKDAATALRELARLEPAQRLPALIFAAQDRAGEHAVLRSVMQRGAYDEGDVEALYEALRSVRGAEFAPSRKKVASVLEWWTRPAEFGERYLQALTTYVDVFFGEEERRIYPALQTAYREAQALAERLDAPELLEELSQGVSIERALRMDELILAPSFWSAPLMFISHLDGDRMLILFGGRPSDASLIPGEVVPDALLRALKALSDPTRLKIMRYLAAGSLTPTQLAHRLRLRAPTVVHHLKTLRVAGLVQVKIAEGKERSYTMRHDSVEATCLALQRFIGEQVPVDADSVEQE